MSNSKQMHGLAVFILCTPLFASAVSAAQGDVSSADSNEPGILVTALRTENGARPSRVDEHVATHVFWVQSKARQVNLSCVISDLKISNSNKPQADYPQGVQALQVDTDRGCYIEVPGAVATIGGNPFKIAPFSDRSKSGASGITETDYVTFQSIGGEAFEQDVYVTVYWRQNSAMQLSGTYEGAVKLLARIPNELERPQ